MRGPSENSVKRAAVLAEKFEAATSQGVASKRRAAGRQPLPVTDVRTWGDKNMNRLFAFSILSLASFPSFPSQTSKYTAPSYVTVQSNSNVVRVWFPNSVRTGAIPSCAAAPSGGYFALAFSLTTDAGKAMFQEILGFGGLGGYTPPGGYSSMSGLWAVGTGDCGVLSGTESLSMIIGPPASGP